MVQNDSQPWASKPFGNTMWARIGVVKMPPVRFLDKSTTLRPAEFFPYPPLTVLLLDYN
jgi:hypothetical protein